ncbi:MAG TPA: pyridoxamine 5'-phosphate oxidase family protein [Microlunatus sp.]|nr:pyridoxamine 5'-phosphate oxidase family protein [Microlunatus sp.]
MEEQAAPRPTAVRRQDTLHRLEQDVDLWVATADPATGDPALVPLSYLWDGTTLLLSTEATTPTARNLGVGRKARLALGPTRDVTMIDAECEAVVPAGEIPAAVGDAFAARTGFDPRADPESYRYFRLRPVRIQAWREANELPGRTLMIKGRWR